MIRALPQSSIEVLVLQAIWLSGPVDALGAANRYGLDPVEVAGVISDAADHGLVLPQSVPGARGWLLTAAGQEENLRALAEELEVVDGEDVVAEVYRELVPLNRILTRACTDWQLRPVAGEPFAVNDHTDVDWDAAVLLELAGINSALPPAIEALVAVLGRFRGYDLRFADALSAVRAGDVTRVDRSDVDSCHRVWFELFEDLLATLGLDRDAELDVLVGGRHLLR